MVSFNNIHNNWCTHIAWPTDAMLMRCFVSLIVCSIVFLVFVFHDISTVLNCINNFKSQVFIEWYGPVILYENIEHHRFSNSRATSSNNRRSNPLVLKLWEDVQIVYFKVVILVFIEMIVSSFVTIQINYGILVNRPFYFLWTQFKTRSQSMLSRFS